MAKTIEDSARTFDAVALLLDKGRDIDRQIYDALAEYIRLDGLTLTVKSFDDGIRYPPQHMREAELTDGYAHAVVQVVVEIFLENRKRYIDSLARRMVSIFAQERYLIKR